MFVAISIFISHREAHFEFFSFLPNFSSIKSAALYFRPLSFVHPLTHLTVVTGHGEQGNGACGVAAVADRGHVSVPHDRHGGQLLLARGVWVRHGVALPGRRGERQVLLDLLVLALVEVELGVLQVALYLRGEKRIKSHVGSVSRLDRKKEIFTALKQQQRTHKGFVCSGHVGFGTQC